MTWYQILTIIGIPSVVTALLNWLERRAVRKEKAEEKKNDQTDSLKLGVQALLRAQMINDYNTCVEKGYAPIWVRDSFENVYKQYETLGKNGVMEDIRKKFYALPTQPKGDAV